VSRTARAVSTEGEITRPPSGVSRTARAVSTSGGLERRPIAREAAGCTGLAGFARGLLPSEYPTQAPGRV